jgi:hypothetical protein
MRNATSSRLRRWQAFAASCVVAGCTAYAACAAESFAQPFAYCAAVGTIDGPDARYVGPAVPEAIARGLQRAFGVAATEPLAPFERGTTWRCMDGAVYACNVGANLPCTEKPAREPQPSKGMRTYCAQNPGSDFIPMYVTGHATIFDWSCDGTAPRRGKQTAELDARGFMASIWHRIEPPGAGAGRDGTPVQR